MADDSNLEEQAMEAEALEAIFEDHFTKIDDAHWTVDLYPETEGGHVACQLELTLPADYPESSVPTIAQVHILQGLTAEHATALQRLAEEEAENNAGLPSVFAICERLREWLLEHNEAGLDDLSMHAQMMRKKLEQQKQQQAAERSSAFESQTVTEELTQAEKEELAVRKRRAEGTPCNAENFAAWKARFEAEQAAFAQVAQEQEESKKKLNVTAARQLADKSNRQTGYDFFRKNNAGSNLEALEAAAENAEADSDEEEENLDVQEDLFDDDVDLDDLDFDDDDDEEDEDIDI